MHGNASINMAPSIHNFHSGNYFVVFFFGCVLVFIFIALLLFPLIHLSVMWFFVLGASEEKRENYTAMLNNASESMDLKCKIDWS